MLAGSFESDNIEDYYVMPYEIGYGPFVRFDHDFVGREAPEKIADGPHRRKVTFAWNADDVAKVFRSMLESGGGTAKPTVERHRQIEIRAVVSPAPYSEVVRETYAGGWRTGT